MAMVTHRQQHANVVLPTLYHYMLSLVLLIEIESRCISIEPPVIITQDSDISILCVRPEHGENKQAQTQAVSCLYSHQCGGNMQVLRGVRSDS